MSEHFQLNRLLYLLRVDLLARYRTMIIASGAIAGVMVVLTLLFRMSSDTSAVFYSILLACMLYLWGAIASSRSFREMHDKTQNEAYLILPASALEKMIARLLLIMVGFPIYAVVFVTVLSWLTAGLQTLLNGTFVPAFSPAPFLTLQMLGFFLVNQSIYFLGGSWFRKQHFIKTVLAVTVFWTGLLLFIALVFRIFFPDLELIGTGIDPGDWFQYYRQTIFGVFDVLEFIWYFGVPAFCWYVAWLRIKETQVSYGV